MADGEAKRTKAWKKKVNFVEFKYPKRTCDNCGHAKWVNSAIPYSACELSWEEADVTVCGGDSICDRWKKSK